MNNMNILLFLSCLIFYKYSEIKNEYIKNGVLILSFYFLYNILVKKEGMRTLRATDFASPNFTFDNNEPDNGPVRGDCIVTGLERPYYISNNAGEVEENRNQVKTFIDDNNLELPDDSNCKNTRNGSSDFYLKDNEACHYKCSDENKVIVRPGETVTKTTPDRHVIKCETDENSGLGQIKFDNEVICSPKPRDTDRGDTGSETSNINAVCIAGDKDLIYDDKEPKTGDIWDNCISKSVPLDPSDKTTVQDCCKPAAGKTVSYVNPALSEKWSSLRDRSNVTWGVGLCVLALVIILYGINSEGPDAGGPGAPVSQGRAAYDQSVAKYSLAGIRFAPHFMIKNATVQGKKTGIRIAILVGIFIVAIGLIHWAYYAELKNSNGYKNPTRFGFDSAAKKVTDETTYWTLMFWGLGGKDIETDASFKVSPKEGTGRGLKIPS